VLLLIGDYSREPQSAVDPQQHRPDEAWSSLLQARRIEVRPEACGELDKYGAAKRGLRSYPVVMRRKAWTLVWYIVTRVP
jgi:hypothetical protein